MNASEAGALPEEPSGSLRRRILWHCRHDPKRELWIAWWTMVVFYQLFGVLFFVVTSTQPPPPPGWEPTRVAQWFNDHHYGLLIGFAFVFIISGLTALMNALIAYSMRRMSVSRAFAYSYLVIYALSTLPGMLLLGIALTVGAMRPDRDPEQISWLYDFAFMTFDGTMGVFLVGSLVWMTAILLDKNRVFPKWFAYLNLCNALTEVVVAPAWIFKSGVFAWDGVIAWWINVGVFVTYTTVFLTLLRRMIVREDFGTGPLPDLVTDEAPEPSDWRKATR
ncbi:MAG: hypothetical protein ACREJO_17230 [Phycisphaerales bacterium]